VENTKHTVENQKKSNYLTNLTYKLVAKLCIRASHCFAEFALKWESLNIVSNSVTGRWAKQD